MAERYPPNPFQTMSDEQLARECNRFVEMIEKRSRRTKAGDDIRALLIACGNRLWWMKPGYQPPPQEPRDDS